MFGSSLVIAITVQPFMKGVTEETTKQSGRKIVNQLKEAGYSDIKMGLKRMKRVGTVCTLGNKDIKNLFFIALMGALVE